jgi:hypothetical protein
MTDAIKAVVAEWYGLPPSQMPMLVLTREQERESFETDHPEIPSWCWAAVNHAARQTFLWTRRPDVDLVVWNHARGGYCLIQDLCFKDAYPDETAWWAAVQKEVTERSQVWVVFHE